jgi:3-methylcrotonyl-CoA carboxylase alpha subunit
VRIDSGVDEGDEITPHYDPMIAKLIVWDDSRELALTRMLQALSAYRIVGVASNVEFLSRLVACPAFQSAELATDLIEHERDFLFPLEAVPPREAWLLAALAELLFESHGLHTIEERSGDPHSPWNQRDGWRINGVARRRLTYRNGETQKSIDVEYASGGYRFGLDGRTSSMRGQLLDGGRQLRAEIDGYRLLASVIHAGERRHVFLHGHTWVLNAVDPLFHGGAGASVEGPLVAPMPGRIIALIASVGDQVEKGTPLLILEAMKMEHTIVARTGGTVKAFHYGVGDQVAEGTELVELELLEK